MRGIYICMRRGEGEREEQGGAEGGEGEGGHTWSDHWTAAVEDL